MGLKDKFRKWANIAIIGLSGSGKTTFYRWLTDNPELDHSDNVSSTGVSKTRIEIGGEKFRIIDTPGQDVFQKWWEREVKNAEIVFFFVDLADESLYEKAKERFQQVLENVKSRKKNLVLVLNKIDLFYQNDPDREEKLMQKMAEMVDYFEFGELLKQEDSFLVVPISALTGENCDKLIKMVYHQVTGNYLDTRLTVDNMIIVDNNGIVQFHKGKLDNLESKFEGALAQLINKGIELMADSDDPLFTITRGNSFIVYYKTPEFYLILVVDVHLDTKRAITIIKDTAEFLQRTNWIHLPPEKQKEKILQLLKEQIAITSYN